MCRVAIVLLAAAVSGAAALDAAADDKAPGAVARVVKLLGEMKTQVEKEGETDKAAYEKYDCWCVTNDAEKTKAIADAETRIDDLTSDIEEYAALSAKLKTEIGQLEDDIASNLRALETATAQREKEQAEFAAEEADQKQAMGAMKEALDVLSKVQLVQKQKGQEAKVGEMLLQVRETVRRIPNLKQYRNVMQADLWDFLSATKKDDSTSLRGLSALATKVQQPIEGGGAAAGAKSYNSASGQIVGILSQMLDTFTADLSSSQKTELSSLIAFHNLRAAKQAEIDAMTKQRDAKTQELADTTQADAQAKEDVVATKEQLGADQAFLIDLKKGCKIAGEEYAARQKMRADEVMALGEALKILTGDEARELFGKTMSFLQTSSVTSGKAQNTLRNQAMKEILAVARRTKNWQLAALAVSTQLDGFVKVKEAMDKLMAELKQQQKDEYEKNDFCKKELDTNEDTTKVKNYEKQDLDDKLADLKSEIEVLTGEIDNLNKEIAEMQVSLKRAGEDRKAENQDFQEQVADQRAVVHIMNKVLDRLNEFYAKKSFAQVGVHDHQAPPPKPAATAEKSGGAGGALQLIAMIIEDAEKEELELVHDEQSAQESYAGFVTETNTCMAAAQQSIVEKEEALGLAKAGKAETEAGLMAVNAELTSLASLNVGLHKDCDFLLENFEIRQKARKEEMNSIDEAKAILSGAGR